MLSVKCSSCGASYQLAEDLYTRKAAGFGVIVTCRRCKNEIHVELPREAGDGDVPSDAVTAPLPKSDPTPSPEPATPIAPALTEGTTKPSDGKKSGNKPSPPARHGAPRPPRRDPVAGPFVALSPGLLQAAQVKGESPRAPVVSSDLFQADDDDLEIPIDSTDFIRESGKARPKPVPARPKPPKPASPEPPKVREKPGSDAEASPLALTSKKPVPPRARRPPDVADDLLSADLSFDAPAVGAPAPILAAPDAALLTTAPVSSKPPAAARAKIEPTPTEASKKRSGTGTLAVAVLVIAGGAGAAFALRGERAPEEPVSTAPSPPVAEETPAAAPREPETTPSEPEAETGKEPATTASAGTPLRAAEARPSPAPNTATVARAAAEQKPATTGTPTSVPSPAAPAADPPAEEPAGKPAGPFDANAAREALAGAVSQASACRKPGDPTGVAAVTLTFSPSGRVTTATIGGPPFAGTPTGGCIAATLRRARVPPFEGDLVTVRKTVEIR